MTSEETAATTKAFRLGRWTVFPDRLTVTGSVGSRAVEPMSMRLLVALADKAPETLTRDEIIDALWQGRIVTDDAINKQISKLRAALTDPADDSPLIQTVPKVGVRLADLPRPIVAATARSVRSGGALAIVAVAAATAWFVAFPASPPELIEGPLTTGLGAEFDPAVSADGGMLAYAARNPGSPARLFVRSMNRDDAQAIALPGVEATTPAWSRDGKLAFVGRRGSDCRIYVRDQSGSPRAIASCVAADFGGLAWLSNAAVIVSDRSGVGRSFQLSLLNVADGTVRQLLAPPRGDVGDIHPLAARDGKSIYFLRNSTVGSSELYALSLTNATLKSLTTHGTQINGFALGPGQNLIVSAQRRDGGVALWQLGVATGAWVRLGPSAAPDLSGSLDGRTFAYSQVERQTVLWRMPLDSKGPGAPLTPSTQSDWSPVISPDGKTLAFLSDRSGSEEIWLLNLEGGLSRPLTSFGGPKIQDLAWSPDSSALLTSVPSGGQFDVFRIEVANGRKRALARTNQDERHAAFTSDGSGLLFVRRSGSRFELRRYDLAARRESLVMDRVMRQVPAAPAGMIIYTRPFENGVWAAEINGRARKIADFPDMTRMRDIAVTSGTLWAVRADGDDQRLVAISLRSGVQRPLRLLPGIARPSGIAITGNSVIYARSLRVEADLFVVRLKD